MVKTRRTSNLNTSFETAKVEIERRQSLKKDVDDMVMNKINKKYLRNSILNKIRCNTKKDHFLRKKTAYDMNIESTLSSQQQKLTCPICMQIMMMPSIIPCGHTFCLHCIEESLKYNNTCSLCRQMFDYQSPAFSKVVELFIDKTMRFCQDQEETRSYQNRMKIYQSKNKQTRVDTSVKEGDKVDIYMNNCWKEGIVAQVKQINKTNSIVKVKSWGIQRKLLLSSRLLAKQGAYTKPPIPKYEKIPMRNELVVINQPLFFFDFSDVNLWFEDL